MNEMKKVVALFDLDGVIIDSETQYLKFWGSVGEVYLPNIPDFASRIKGQTLTQIYEQYFKDDERQQAELTRQLLDFEEKMNYNYIPGAMKFMQELHDKGVKMAIVTSSNEQKMERVYAAHPELSSLVDKILTAEMFAHSKPAPDCFLLGAECFGVSNEQCVVFEDSFNGLKAGVSAGMIVIGLSTTNSAESIVGRCNKVIPDFNSFSYTDMMTLITTSHPLSV